MEDPDLTQRHLLTEEVDVNLDVLRAPMMYRIDCHVYCTHIITVGNSGRSERDMKLLEKLAQPATFGHSMSHSTRYSASALDRDTVVWRLEDQDTRLSPR